MQGGKPPLAFDSQPPNDHSVSLGKLVSADFKEVLFLTTRNEWNVVESVSSLGVRPFQG